jgi:hypothetical protein
MRRFGDGLEVAWLQDARYAGTVSGHFRVDGTGTSAATLTLTGGGRVSRASLFNGTLADADVSVEIAQGTLRASYNGRFAAIDPSIPFADSRLAGSLTGSGAMDATVRELLRRPVALDDYDVHGGLALGPSRLRDLQLDAATINATLRDSTLAIARVALRGPAVEGNGNGTVAFIGDVTSDFNYDLLRVELEQVPWIVGESVQGTLSTKGRLNGPWTAMRAAGNASITHLDALNVEALSISGDYDVTVPSGTPLTPRAMSTDEASFWRGRPGAAGSVRNRDLRRPANRLRSGDETGSKAATAGWREQSRFGRSSAKPRSSI